MQKTAPKPTVEPWGQTLRRVPIVVVIGVLLLALWGLRMPGPRGVVCDRAAPNQVHCRATLPRPWAWLPQTDRAFELQDIAITSDLCDSTPRGGVRFCHRLALIGPGQQVTLPEVRTPLSSAALTDQLQRFRAGDGSPQLVWSSPPLGLPWRTIAIALFLAIALWALWDVRWPPPPPLALDGVDRPSGASNSTPN